MIRKRVAAEHAFHLLGLHSFLRQASHCWRQLRVKVVTFESIERDQDQFGCLVDLTFDSQGQANQQNCLKKQL